jgi:uncharacterized protein
MRRIAMPVLMLALATAPALAADTAHPALPRSGDVPNAVIADPHPDKAHPPAMFYVRVESHGSLMNGVVYTPSGAGPNPAVVLYHGFPGNEQNLDLAQAMRRAGFVVLTFHYRGAWGSPGEFTFSNALHDADAAVAFMRDPANVAKFHIDPRRIFVAGHSMGGMMAASAAARAPFVAGVVLISAWDIGADGASFNDPAVRQKMKDGEFTADVIPLAGATADGLLDEAAANAANWDFVDFAPQLKTRPFLILTADDGLTENNSRLAAALKKAGDGDVIQVHMATDHSYSDHRIEMESAVVRWLERHQAMVAVKKKK